MMTKKIVLMVLLFCMGKGVQAQDASKLNVPVSPAFSILGFEPSAVMRPTNAKSLATDVLSSFDQNGKLLMNLGLEVAPYWLKNRPYLERKMYLNSKPGQTFLQSLSISVGTAKDSASGSNKLGAGFRFRLANGKPVAALDTAEALLTAQNNIDVVLGEVRATIKKGDSVESIIGKIKTRLKNELSLDDNIINSIISQAEKLAEAGDYENSKEGMRKFLEAVITDRDNANEELKEKVSKLAYDRTGFIVEFAGATGYVSDVKRFERIGFWGNLSYGVSADDLFTLTARYMHQQNDTSINNVDVGLGFLRKAPTYNISVEAMLRWYRAELPTFNASNQPITKLEKKFTYRLAVQGSYSINKEISVNLSIGKDFETPFFSGKGVFSILGLNYSIFNKEPTKQK